MEVFHQIIQKSNLLQNHQCQKSKDQRFLINNQWFHKKIKKEIVRLVLKMLGIASQMTLLSTQTIKEVVFKGNRTEVNIPCKKIRDKMNRI